MKEAGDVSLVFGVVSSFSSLNMFSMLAWVSWVKLELVSQEIARDLGLFWLGFYGQMPFQTSTTQQSILGIFKCH